MAIFVPTKINVGFQNRSDTYSGKLAYIIYFDEKGKLRKETSWQHWRDKEIQNEIYDNEPIEGFVLNKKVGGDRYSWNPRQTYTRVYDPRGFEFEITIPNLLWILENCNCIKGKGLEGQFVYGWDGKLSKHMMHLVRLYLMALDILERKEIVTYREKDHDFLMEIRNGKYLDENRQPIPEFFTLVDSLQTKFDYAKNNTDLPENPDYKKINEFVASVNERIVRGEI